MSAESGAVAEFAAALRALRRSAGSPSYRRLAVLAHFSGPTLSRATAGHRLPTREVALALATACGGDPAEWARRWEETAAAVSDARESPGPAARVGNFLPRDTADFTGRERETAQVEDGLRDAAATTVFVITGMGGAGKTALAVHLAHRLTDRFPDGQLYLDLHGHTPSRPALEPSAALESLLRAIGVTGSLPDSADELAGRWRAAMAGRRALLVLDDAAGQGQVEPLLPAARECVVFVTSRGQLAGLAGVTALPLNPLSDEAAARLFTAVAGGRVAAEPEAVARVVGLCAGLPLAVRIAAARLRSRPAWTVVHLEHALSDQRRRLAQLSPGGDGLTSALTLSYVALPSSCRTLLRLMAVAHPGYDFDADCAAAVLQCTSNEALETLETLVDAAMLESPEPDRYRFHDLVKLYAQSRSDGRDAEEVGAISRLLRHYADFVAKLAPGALREIRQAPASRPERARFEAERDNLRYAVLMAAERGFDAEAVEIARALTDYLIARGDAWRELLLLAPPFADSARTLSDVAGLAHAWLGQASAMTFSGRPGAAIDLFEQALAEAVHAESAESAPLRSRIHAAYGVAQRILGQLDSAIRSGHAALDAARESGDSGLEIAAIASLADALRRSGAADDALKVLDTGMILAIRDGNRRGEGTLLNIIAGVHAARGDHVQALLHCERIDAIFRRIGDTTNQAINLGNIGYLLTRLNRPDEALTTLERAAAVLRDSGDLRAEASNLNNIGFLHLLLGRHQEARHAYEQGRTIARQGGALDLLTEAYIGLGKLDHELGQFPTALELYRQALDLALQGADPRFRAHSHRGLALAHAAMADDRQAREHWSRALDLYEQLGMPEADELRSAPLGGQPRRPGPSTETKTKTETETETEAETEVQRSGAPEARVHSSAKLPDTPG